MKYFQESENFFKNHPQDQIIGNPSIVVRTRSSLINIYNNIAFISQIEPKKLNDVIGHKPNDQSAIGTTWVFRNKMNENDIIVRKFYSMYHTFHIE